MVKNVIVRYLLVGCGRIATRHAEIISKTGVLIAVCDVDAEKSAQFANRFHARSYTSLERMLHESQGDVLVVCTPNGFHATHSILGLESGLHVICEKPMAIRSSDCTLMIQASELTGRKLFIVKQNRYNPPVEFVQDLIQNKQLGEILSIQVNGFWNRNKEYYADDWRGTKAIDGGILFTQFSHFIDLMYWWMGPVQRASGYAKNFLHHNCTEFPDTVVASLCFENGSTGAIHFTTNAYSKNVEGSVTLIGETGIVKIGGAYLNNLDYIHVQGVETVRLKIGSPANDYGFYEGSMSNHHIVYNHVLSHILNNSSEKTNMYESMKTVELIEKIEQSLIVI
ncbi:MAG: Gfo/Idh/MocA family oxidoreductase [Ferruginibacter sp.]|nr:Gfo/Idh/MocA family oxidoreductase [Ferruginibacter sp.]